MHQCTYYQNDGHLGKGLHLEFFIGHTIFSKSGLNRGIFSVSLFENSGNEHGTGMAVILKNGFHPEFLKRFVYSNEPESYAGGDFISLASLTRPDRSKERRQTKQTL